MVTAVREGASVRAVARAHNVSLSTVQWWLRRAGRRLLDQVDWSDHPPIAHRIRRTPSKVEDLVLVLRRELKETSALGEYGARAIHRELTARGHQGVPALRSIGGASRHGALLDT
jgi:transposase-like protein